MRWMIVLLAVFVGCGKSDAVHIAWSKDYETKFNNHEERIVTLEKSLPSIAGMAQSGQISGDTAKARVDELAARLSPVANGRLVSSHSPASPTSGQYTDANGVHWTWKQAADGSVCATNNYGRTFCRAAGSNEYRPAGGSCSGGGCSTGVPTNYSTGGWYPGKLLFGGS